LLLDLKKNIEIYASKIKLMCSLDRNGDINIEFQNLFDSFVYNMNFTETMEFDERFAEIDLSNLIEKFNFYAVKSASKAFECTVDKIIFIQDRLYDYKQTKNMYKKDCIIEVMLSQSKDFEKLCTIELERLNKKLELELELKVGSIKVSEKTLAQIPKPETNTFNWNVSATDLLELIVALYKTESLKRTDGSSFTRKELIDYFQDLFGLEIKDVEIKLARATNRKMTMTPFLDKLKVAFENYAEVKEEKQQKRK
ncbi:MAG: RteC domain-containing protein, partial [Bacteroidota bacterium]|nr:RteC domain-containing protein [Bacteroidota bacterium]